MSVSKALVIEAASNIADEKGLNQVSLKNVAERLNIKTPSLYNHIDSLDSLLREVAHKGMRTMNEQMARTAIGKSGEQALKAVGTAYLNYMIAHPGVYETIQWATWHGTEETKEIFEEYEELLLTLIRSCNIEAGREQEVVNLFSGIFHGYNTLQLGHAFTHEDEVRENLCRGIEILLLGIRKTN